MEDNEKDTEQSGGEAAGVLIFLQIRCPVGVAIWCGDVGGYPPGGKGTGVFPRPVGAATDGADAAVEVGR